MHLFCLLLCVVKLIVNSVDIVDRGNDNWLIKYEKPAGTDSQPEVVMVHFK